MAAVVSETLTLPANPRSPGRARDFVESLLASWGLLRMRHEAKLLTSELVTNAVLHARTDLTLTVSRDDERGIIRVSVGDESQAAPTRRRYSPLASTGRGLAMISEGAQAFGVDPAPAGKAVWFELAVDGSRRDDDTEHLT